MAEVLRGARFFADPDGEPLDIVVDEGVISAVAKAGTARGARIVDLDGLEVMPGAIDSHVHPVHDETFSSVGRAAPFGGITTICHQLYPAPDESFSDAMARMIMESAAGTSDYAAHVRWDPSRSQADVQAAADAGALSIKVFMAHPDKAVQANLGDLSAAMTAAGLSGILTLVHAELGSVIDRLQDFGLAETTTLRGIGEWRSAANEAAAVRAAAVISVATSARCYVVHTSSEEALKECLMARLRQTAIYVETCPHYLFLDEDSSPPGGQGFVLPPLRTAHDREVMRQAVANGDVDTVGSDHCGHGPAAKRPDSLEGSKAGLPGIEAMLPLLLDAALGADAWLPRRRLVEVLCEGPARVFRLHRKGRIAPGYDADIVSVDPTQLHTLTKADLHDASDYSPYEGRRTRGSVQQVWRRGTLVIDRGRAQAEGGGKFVARS